MVVRGCFSLHAYQIGLLFYEYKLDLKVGDGALRPSGNWPEPTMQHGQSE